MGVAGLEQPNNSSQKPAIHVQGGTNSGTPVELALNLALQPPRTLPSDLVSIINAWPELPAAIRAGIFAMVQAAKNGL